MSEPTYFLLLNKQEAGPFTLAQIQALVASGQIPDHTFFAAPGMAEWKHVSELLAAAATPPPPPVPTSAPASVVAPAPKPVVTVRPAPAPMAAPAIAPAPTSRSLAPPSLAPAPPPAPPRPAPRPAASTPPLAPPPMAPPAAAEKKPGGSGKKMLLVGGAATLVLVLAALAVGWFLRPHTPKSSEPPPAIVSYKKREKFSQQHITIPESDWEKKLGRNLHKVAFQAATNLVLQNMSNPDDARFQPIKQAQIVGVQWRFRVQGRVDVTKNSGTEKSYDYEIYLKRSAAEDWTVEDVSIRKSTDPAVRTGKDSE